MLVVLGVHGDGQAEPRGPLPSREQRVVVGLLEVVDPGVAHEGLEPDHAPVGQLVEPVDVAGDEPAPEREVDDRRCRRRPRA